jgi:hypothetical protein
LSGVVDGHLRVQRGQQRLGITEVTVEIDFGEQQGEVLEILPDDRPLAVRERRSFSRCVCLTMFWSYSSSRSVGSCVRLKSCAVSAW